MTALDKYAKLEAIARYRDGPTDQMREVVLSFGERTLMIVGLDDRPISHWPLINVHRLPSDTRSKVLLAPFEGSLERIELADAEMIEAIDTIVPLDRPQRMSAQAPRRRWGRWIALLCLGGAVGALIWAMPMLMERAVDLVPEDRAAVIGAAVRTDALAMIGIPEDGEGATCTEPEGRAALDALVALAMGETVGANGVAPRAEVSVLDHPAPFALALPGGEILLLSGMIDAAPTPEALTALLAHQIAHARARNPMRKILRKATVSEKLAHIAGDLLDEPIPETAATVLLTQSYTLAEETAADQAVIAALTAADLPSTPYAALLLQLTVSARPGPRHGDIHPGLKIRASRADALDPIGDKPFRPALSDRDWLVLQTICDEI
ncbi:MAG: M48 family metalloprotease [Pseudomonadota bacterium]